MRPEEEKELNEVLFVSLRKIPENGNVSEDDVDDVDNNEEDIKKKMRKNLHAFPPFLTLILVLLSWTSFQAERRSGVSSSSLEPQ